MIVFEGRADIFTSTCQTITCPINVVGTLGNGLAKLFKDNVPGLDIYYRKEYPPRPTQPPAGLVHRILTYRPPTGPQVLLFPTKEHWRDPSQLNWIETNLDFVAKHYTNLGIQSLAIPALGCGKGTLPYAEMRRIFYFYLDPIPLPVEICLL